MSWLGVEGHDAVVERFRLALTRGRLASSFLFVGPEGIGKKLFALRLAQTLLCQAVAPEAMAPCGECHGCRLVAAGTHPDLIQIARPAEKTVIPLALLIGEDGRMQSGLCHEIGLKPFFGGRKVALIDDADQLNVEGANALLKTLEEPPPFSVLILISHSLDKQLPTIRSRCQIVRFAPLSESTVARLLIAQGATGDESEAERLARFGEGSLTRAVEHGDAAIWEFRERLLGWLAAPPIAAGPFAAEVLAFVDAAGKDAPSRRRRARQAISFAIDEHRERLRAAGGARRAILSLERSLDALEHIDRMANQSTLLESWLDDLAGIWNARPATASS